MVNATANRVFIEVADLQPMLVEFPECPRCRLGRAIVVDTDGGPNAWDLVAIHKPTCRGAGHRGPRHLTAISTTGGDDAA